jgi:site-specific DNA-cytosine methylase
LIISVKKIISKTLLEAVAKAVIYSKSVSGFKLNHAEFVDGWFRHFTIKELERLQTLPDGYSEGVSDSQRKKAIGNGWTVDVVAHIFKRLNQ